MDIVENAKIARILLRKIDIIFIKKMQRKEDQNFNYLKMNFI